MGENRPPEEQKPPGLKRKYVTLPMVLRKKRFVDSYLVHGNASKAARDAGYSPTSAGKRGSLLLRDPYVRDMILESQVDRKAHANQTYQEIIELKDKALEQIQALMAIKDKVNPRVISLALETAGKQLERLAKIEGLFQLPVEKHDDRMEQTLMDIARRVQEWQGRKESPKREDPVPKEPLVVLEPPEAPGISEQAQVS